MSVPRVVMKRLLAGCGIATVSTVKALRKVVWTWLPEFGK